MSFTTNQWVILGLVLVLGWVLGLASRGGGRKWRRELERERAARIAAEKRIGELERGDRATTTSTTAASVAAAASGARDDLSLINGVGHAHEVQLNEAGYHRFRQVADMTDHQATALEARLGLTAGKIADEEWREQAALLADRKHEEHRSRWGTRSA